ncbi:hypothetical protein AB5I39_12930 [Sphingomonas sp. MMS24-J45]|uniref:hypothetical protein n=1 Tax=Sphingomonas sp. MMS24-J45 TaxID=3238806 RepID=UPI0038503CAD
MLRKIPVRRRAPILAAVALALVALGHALTFWPGILTWDAIRQYGQAVSGSYDDWHPPAMNWLWRQLRAVAAGPGPMLTLQVILYWGGTALWALAGYRRGGWKSAAVIVAAMLSPIAVVLVATILKDSLFAGALLLASGILAVARAGAWRLRLVAAVLLIAAATLRFNAGPACLPLLLIALPDAWRRTVPRLAASAALLAVPLILALPLANAALGAKRSGVELSLVIYDLGGIGRFSGTSAFPPIATPDPVAVNAACYSPVSWDRYAWWGADPCPIGFETLKVPLRQGHGPYGWWAAAVLAHPVAYIEHRLAHFDRNVRFLGHDAEAPGLSTESDPNPWGYTVAPNGVRAAIAQAAAWLLHTPLGWPACWLALGVGLLVLRPSLAAGDPAVALAWSGVMYGFSYLPLSVASEVRYHFWTIAAITIAAVLILSERQASAVGRLRRIAAVLPLAVVLAASVIARL